MNVFLRLGFSFLLLFCASVSAQDSACGAGCHHGFCEQSGECRCRAGWRGAVCDQCVPSPDCVHRVCDEPGQCVCERGWTRARCDREVHRCSSKLCSGNSTCVQTRGGGHVCLCSPGHTGENCELKTGACSETSSLCQNGGTCVNMSDSCLCAPGFTGSSCELHISRLKHRPRVKVSGHTFHKLQRPVESDPLVTRSQIICFSVLGLLTCLVILVTSGIVFFSRCETWMANTKYSQLVRQQRDQLLRASDLEQRSLNIILPENIRMSNYSRLYTSI
ncbi:protein delta homolog 1-like isoform X1 [Carassius gibelio]|uniref:protein delta homolog 1-like isoform X1 n=1 Tax=Carassius gibelio TaxID=101364 RepID=UPI00227804CE|nr:protein delta homolog 1-like isoform X1 [Carassius gibelio]